MKQIVGHKSQVEQLRKAIESKRLPNAYLFVGPEGVGKRLVADSLALSMACLNNKGTWDACDECPGCMKSTNGNHPDQLLIEPSGENIKIDQIRELQSNLRFHPMESARKIVVVDDADRMTEAAANSLLKVLEEPPDMTHFVLVSSMPHRLLPTIRSRCQTIPFSPLRDVDLTKHISRVRGIPEADAMRLARFAGGSLGKALTIDVDFIDEILNRFITITKRASTADILESSQAWANENPDRIRLILDLLISWYRDVLRCQSTGEICPATHPEAAATAGVESPSRVEANLQEIARTRASLEINANKQLMFEHLLFSLTA